MIRERARRVWFLLAILILICFLVNPRTLKAEEDPYQGKIVFFGDIHNHTILSDGAKTLSDTLEFARNISQPDFMVFTDHIFFLTAEEWAETIAFNNQNNQPDQLVLLNAFEWNHWNKGEGHKNVYYLDQGPFLPMDQYPSPRELWQALKGVQAITIPHHVAGIHNDKDGSNPKYFYSTDWDYRQDQLQTLVEIFSRWGSGECETCWLNRRQEYNPFLNPSLNPDGIWYESGHFVQDALARGFRLGFVGGSDSHDGNPAGQNIPAPATRSGLANSGLTGIWADEITRESIFQAMKTRNTFATTGCQTKIKFSADGKPMGSEYLTAYPPTFKVEIEAYDNNYQPQPAIMAKAEIVKGTIGATSPFPTVYEEPDCQGQTSCSFTWQDTSFNHDAFYYLRVIHQPTPWPFIDQSGNPQSFDLPHLAWSSPIWVNYAPEEINLMGQPSYDITKEFGFFIWKDNNQQWHLRWTGSKTGHQAKGKVTSSSAFTEVVPWELEEVDIINVESNLISFEAIAWEGEDGIDFKNSGQVNFDLTIDGEKNDGLVFYGPNREHININKPIKPGDVNGDGRVDEIDYAAVITYFGQSGAPGTVIGDVYPIDIPDGAVDERDYATIINFFDT